MLSVYVAVKLLLVCTLVSELFLKWVSPSCGFCGIADSLTCSMCAEQDREGGRVEGVYERSDEKRWKKMKKCSVERERGGTCRMWLEI